MRQKLKDDFFMKKNETMALPFLTMITSMITSYKKGMDVSSGFNFMLGALVLTILAFTWFFPTLNGANALNNSSALEIGGQSYSWVVPLVVILVIIGLVMYYFKSSGI